MPAKCRTRNPTQKITTAKEEPKQMKLKASKIPVKLSKFAAQKNDALRAVKETFNEETKQKKDGRNCKEEISLS